jgi:methyl-accepting chemotaxis protein
MFNWLNHMKIGGKIVLGFLLLVVGMGGALGGMSWFNLQKTTDIVKEITEQRVPSVKQGTEAERNALHTILDEKRYVQAANDGSGSVVEYRQTVLNGVDMFIKALGQVYAVAEAQNDPALLENLNKSRSVAEQYRDLFEQVNERVDKNKTAVKTLEQAANALSNGLSFFFRGKLDDLQIDTSTDPQANKGKTKQEIVDATQRDIKQLEYIFSIWSTALENSQLEKNYALNVDQNGLTVLLGNQDKMANSFANLKSITTDEEELLTIGTLEKSTQQYFEAVQEWANNNKDLATLQANMDSMGEIMQTDAIEIQDAGWSAIAGSSERADGVLSDNVRNLMIASVASLLIGLLLAWTIAGNITKPLAYIVRAAEHLSVGDMAGESNEKMQNSIRRRRDEIGLIGQAFDQLVTYLQTMGEHANAIARKDLTVEVQPFSEKDALGQSIREMALQLREAIGQVAESAINLEMASSQLSNVASQAGLATNQIANTMQQVAHGTAQQSESVNLTAVSVEQMSRAIDGVAKGAQEQAGAVGKASAMTSQISAAIREVTENAHAGSAGSDEAARVAREGAATVRPP